MTIGEAMKQAWPLGVATYTLRKIEQAVELGTGCQQYWYRGHPREFPLLVPKIHREPLHSARENIEFWAGQRFRLRGRLFTSKVPRWGDYISWLMLMQHNGVPTRLLDWTESVLVALFFATDDMEHDGELWGMNPSDLNAHSDNCRICMPDDRRIRYLAAEVFIDRKDLPELAKRLALANVPERPLAFIPPFEFPRMAAQMSRFTIHPSIDGNALIEFLVRDEKHLVRYLVPRDCKRQLRRNLASLGITRETLFHSLESLAETIQEEILEKDYPLLAPPHFDETDCTPD